MFKFEECGAFTTNFVLSVFIVVFVMIVITNYRNKDTLETVMRMQGYIICFLGYMSFGLPTNSILIESNVTGDYEIFQSGFLFGRTYKWTNDSNNPRRNYCLFAPDTFTMEHRVERNGSAFTFFTIMLGFFAFSYQRIMTWYFGILISVTIIYFLSMQSVLEDLYQIKMEYGGVDEWKITVNNGEIAHMYRSIQMIGFQMVLGWIVQHIEMCRSD